MSKPYLLGIDNGGSQLKCALFDTRGKEITVSGQAIPYSMPAPGHTERDADQVWETLCGLIRQVLADSEVDPGDIAGVSVCGYGGGLCLLDSSGKPSAPLIVSTDTRAEPLLRRWMEDGTNQRVYSLTYQDLWAAQQAVLLPWLRDNNPQMLEGSRWALNIKDYIRYRLTGELYLDYTDCSSNNLLDIHTGTMTGQLLETLGLLEYRDLFPPLLMPHDPAGQITREASAACGLVPGTPVAAGMYDINACCLASGILTPKTLCLVTGTWSINCYLAKDAEEGNGKSGTTVSFLPGHYMLEDSSPTSAGNLDWFVEQYVTPRYPNASPKELYQRCDRLVATMDPEACQVTFVPYLYSSNSTPGAKAAFFGLEGHHTWEDMLLAVYQGVLCSSLYHMERLLGSAKTGKQVRLSGGVANSPVWTQMLCDMLETPVQVMEGTQRGALGAAMCAGVSCGVFGDYRQAAQAMTRVARTYQPDRERSGIYRLGYTRFKSALEALAVFYGQVNQ